MNKCQAEMCVCAQARAFCDRRHTHNFVVFRFFKPMQPGENHLSLRQKTTTAIIDDFRSVRAVT